MDPWPANSSKESLRPGKEIYQGNHHDASFLESSPSYLLYLGLNCLKLHSLFKLHIIVSSPFIIIIVVFIIIAQLSLEHQSQSIAAAITGVYPPHLYF